MSRSSPSLPQKDRTSKPAQALDASVVVGNSITPSDAGQHSTYMLPRIRLLQLGDIHLPTAANLKPHIDAKDQKFSPALKNIISRNPLKTVFRRAYELIDSGTFDAVLFMGDLTDFGNLDSYKACCRYIAGALQLGELGTHSTIPTGIVPGNHDISRPLAREPGMISKFAPLTAALRSAGLPAPPVQQPLKMAIAKGQNAVDIHLLNSCWGCGEDEYIPELFREPIADAIRAVLSGVDGARAEKLYYDNQLDTPAISADAIAQLVDAVRSSPLSRVPVVVAHHNLLPQRLPRLAPYTELVNSGALRSSLMELERPIIFLHGHIHESPVEVIHIPHGLPLVSISAPEVAQGFNAIELVFTPQGLPLSCRVIPWRFDGSAILRQEAPMSIPLLTNRRRSSSPNLGHFFAKIIDHGQCYWGDVVRHARAIVPSITVPGIIEMLELLLADRSIAIENYDLSCGHWLVRAEV